MATRAWVKLDAVISIAVESIYALAGRIAMERYFALSVCGAVVASTRLVLETDRETVAEVVLVTLAGAFSHI